MWKDVEEHSSLRIAEGLRVRAAPTTKALARLPGESGSADEAFSNPQRRMSSLRLSTLRQLPIFPSRRIEVECPLKQFFGKRN